MWVSSHELHVFAVFLTCARFNNLIPDNVMGLKNLKRKCACGSSFVKIIWKLLSLKMSTTSGSAFCRNYQKIKGCRSCEELVEVIVCIFNSLLLSVCSLSLVASVMLYIYILNYPVMYLLSERASGSKHARNRLP